MSQAERDLVLKSRGGPQLLGWGLLQQMGRALEARLDAEVGDGEIARILVQLETTFYGPDISQAIKIIRQLLRERDEAQYLNQQWKGYPDLLVEKAALEARVKELKGLVHVLHPDTVLEVDEEDRIHEVKP